jgi:hypothetical protein
MRETFATLAGYLKRLLSAWVVEIVLESPTFKALAAAAGPLAPVVTAGATALLTTGMNALLNPIINTLLSFPTGARFDEPTLAVIGDGNRLGGENREWLFRDEQLHQVLDWVLGRYEQRMAEGFARLENAIASTQIKGVVRGSVIYCLSVSVPVRMKCAA